MSRRANFGGQLTGPDSSSAPSLLTTSAAPPADDHDHDHDHSADHSGVDTPPQGSHNPNKGKQKARAAAARLTAAAAAPNPDAGVSGERECFLCAEEATNWAVGECGHRTCDVCAVRMRALYKKTECSFCKVSKTGAPSHHCTFLFGRSGAHTNLPLADGMPASCLHFVADQGVCRSASGRDAVQR